MNYVKTVIKLREIFDNIKVGDILYWGSDKQRIQIETINKCPEEKRKTCIPKNCLRIEFFAKVFWKNGNSTLTHFCIFDGNYKHWIGGKEIDELRTSENKM